MNLIQSFVTIKIVGLIVILAISIPCCIVDYDVKDTDKIPLRQLVKSQEKQESKSAYISVFSFSENSQNKDEIIVRCFGKVDSTFRYIEIPIKKLRIDINDSISLPYLTIQYYLKHDKERTIKEILDNTRFFVYSYTLHCPEIYLPEKLLEIEI